MLVTFRILDPDPMSKNNATQVQNLDPEAKTLWIHMLNIVSGSETLSLYPEIYTFPHRVLLKRAELYMLVY